MVEGSSRTAALWLKERQRPALRTIRLATLAGALAALATIVQLAGMAWLGHATLVDHAGLDSLWPVVGGILAALVTRSLATSWQQHLSARASDDIRRQLRQDLINLLSNGVRLTQQDGRIAVACKSNADVER